MKYIAYIDNAKLRENKRLHFSESHKVIFFPPHFLNNKKKA